jgi:hypothetical protein
MISHNTQRVGRISVIIWLNKNGFMKFSAHGVVLE